MYFVIHNSVVLSKILKIVVPLEQNFEKPDFYSIKLVILIIIAIGTYRGLNGTMIFNILDNTTELCMTKYIIGEIFSSSGATLYKNPSDQTVNDDSTVHCTRLYFSAINWILKRYIIISYYFLLYIRTSPFP